MKKIDVDNEIGSLHAVSAMIAAIGTLIKDLDTAGVLNKKEYCIKLRMLADENETRSPAYKDAATVMRGLADGIEQTDGPTIGRA